MEVGQIADVHLEPSEAYGEADPDAIFTVDIDKMPGAEALEAGQQVYLQNMYGQPFPVKVTAKDESTITFDANKRDAIFANLEMARDMASELDEGKRAEYLKEYTDYQSYRIKAKEIAKEVLAKLK